MVPESHLIEALHQALSPCSPCGILHQSTWSADSYQAPGAGLLQCPAHRMETRLLSIWLEHWQWPWTSSPGLKMHLVQDMLSSTGAQAAISLPSCYYH